MTGALVLLVVGGIVALLFSPEIINLIKRRQRRANRRRGRGRLD